MRSIALAVAAGLTGGVMGLMSATSTSAVEAPKGVTYASIPSQVGGQDIFGPYEVVKGWPKDISTLPGNEKWTYGAGQAIFAESPNRIYALFRGELPNMKRPETKSLTDMGPSIKFPVGRLPWRDATVSSPPGAGGTGQDPSNGMKAWAAAGGKLGVDAEWANCIVVFDGQGNIIERWTQYDSILKRPHFIAVNPYDPEKHVWIVDDHSHVVYKMTNDGKRIVQTIGTRDQPGADGTHFNRPTYIAWLPDSTMFVADGYNGTRVAKFDKDGKFLMDWGQKGAPPNDTRPGYFNNVHGITVDPQTRQVFVNDRGNHRVQVFDENGKYLREWSFGEDPSDVHLIQIHSDRTLWAYDRGTSKMLKYDLNGHFLYAWGVWGDFPGGFWGVHGFTVDQDGNFYVAEVDTGRVQKFRPRQGANAQHLVAKPVYAAWK
jgi:DNA-binding beta-propeller fold protein YncE